MATDAATHLFVQRSKSYPTFVAVREDGTGRLVLAILRELGPEPDPLADGTVVCPVDDHDLPGQTAEVFIVDYDVALEALELVAHRVDEETTALIAEAREELAVQR